MKWFFIVLALVAVLVAVTWAARLNPAITQPIAFNHLLHVEEVGAECSDCHLYATTGARATIPNIEVCADCHEEAQTESAEEIRLVEYIQEGTPIPWRKIYRMPSHVYFSHRRHTELGQIPCETCHGDVGQQTNPVVAPMVDMSMAACMDCHDREGVSNDCVWCHH